MSALDIQVAGSHYKGYAVQPIEFLMKFGKSLDPCQINMVKYLARYPDKNGIIDLRKVVHYSELRSQLKLRQRAFTQAEFLNQFDEQDARIMRLVLEGYTHEAELLVRAMIRDAL